MRWRWFFLTVIPAAAAYNSQSVPGAKPWDAFISGGIMFAIMFGGVKGFEWLSQKMKTKEPNN